MKKIMFNDRFGLTQAVLDGRKTMTRRICSEGAAKEALEFDNLSWAKYQPGEVVAVAQNYTDIGWKKRDVWGHEDFPTRWNHGWENKMFVKAEFMPHQIRITNVRVERLQDISDEDCLREGIYEADSGVMVKVSGYEYDYPCFQYDDYDKFTSPREAFAALIDKVSVNGMWESNPYVFVYEFELIK